MTSMESRKDPARAPAEVCCEREKTYRGKVSYDVLCVWVEEAGPATFADSSLSSPSNRELFRCPVEPENLHSYPEDEWDELEALAEAGLRQLAIVLLTDAMGAEVCRARNQSFLYQVVNALPREWSLTVSEIREFLDVGIPPLCVD